MTTPTTAGVSLTVTGLFWSAGSQVHGLSWVQHTIPPVPRLRTASGSSPREWWDRPC